MIFRTLRRCQGSCLRTYVMFYLPASWFATQAMAVNRVGRVTLKSKEDAQSLISHLTPLESRLLYDTLKPQFNDNAANDAVPLAQEVNLTAAVIRNLFMYNAFPFVGFGFLDNFIMIVSGEYIDMSLGVLLNLSTMAAAGMGNLISDVSGIGLAHYIENIVSRCGLPLPALSADQWKTRKVRFASSAGRAIGLAIGCIIGMTPLIFFDEKKKQILKQQHEVRK